MEFILFIYLFYLCLESKWQSCHSEPSLEYNAAFLTEVWCWAWCQLNENHIGLMRRWFGEREQVKNGADV